MAAVLVGEIFRLRNSEKLGLVIFVRAQSEKGCEDLRIAPVYTQPEIIASATHRDLVIPSTVNSLGRPLLIAAWNARALDSNYLGDRLGYVEPEVVEATRSVELSSIIPGLNLDVAARWLGVRPSGKAAVEAMKLQTTEAAAWDEVERSLGPCDDLETIVVIKNAGIVSGTLTRGIWTEAEAAGVYILNLDLPPFSGEVMGVGQPPGTSSASPTASRTAPNGAVLVYAPETLPASCTG